MTMMDNSVGYERNGHGALDPDAYERRYKPCVQMNHCARCGDDCEGDLCGVCRREMMKAKAGYMK